MSDDGFHEIQLGKKQLVFAFMAAAVALVVAFLIGVWVGRDIRRPETEVAADVPSAEVPTADAPAAAPQPPTQVAANELDYTARLQSGNDAKTDAKDAKAEKKEEPAKPAEPPTPAAESNAVQQTPAKAAPAPKEPAAKETPAPSGSVTLQVGAFGTKKPADTLAARLKAKGYEAFVFTSPSGPSRYKVRVGPFGDRAAADAVSAKLKKDEKLTPIVQR